MSKVNLTQVFILFSLIGYTGCKQSDTLNDAIVTVDVDTDYPEKELILQDIMDVEYIPLETTDEFITLGIVEAVGKDILLTRNRNDGNIFVFDRKTGKGLKKINRLGQGAEEYSGVLGIVLDEDKNEMFVKDHQARKLLVYDLSGNFKRSFKFADTSYYDDLYNYDRDHLISYKKCSTPEEVEHSCHILISKQDGAISEISIPFKEYKTPVITKDELVVTPEYHLTFPTRDNWALVNTSSDTIFKYSQKGVLSPLIIRTPSIQSMEVETFLFPTVITDRYYFMRAMKKELDYTTFKGYPATDLVYDKQDKSVFKYTLYNGDYSNKNEVDFFTKPCNHEIPVCLTLDAPDLVEAYEQGHLKGKLRDIVATMDEEANPVIMLIKYKN